MPNSKDRNAAEGSEDDFGLPNSKSEVIERLRQAVEEAGGNQAVAARSGVPLGTLNNYVRGVNEPKVMALARIMAACGKSLDWLFDFPGQRPLPQSRAPEPPSDIVYIERLAFSGSAGAGTLVIQEAAGTAPVPKSLLERLHLRPDYARMLDSVGNSMLPTIHDGDPLIVDISPDAKTRISDDAIYAFTIGDEAFIKRLRREPGQLMMVSDNAAHFPPRAVPAGEPFRIIGRICWGAREL